MPKIELTKSQCASLVNFIDFAFIPSLRQDPDLDNLQYVINICDAYKVFKEVVDSNEG